MRRVHSESPRKRTVSDDPNLRGPTEQAGSPSHQTISTGDLGGLAARAKELGLARRERLRGASSWRTLRPLSEPAIVAAGFAVPATPLHHDVGGSTHDFSCFLTIDDDEAPESPRRPEQSAGQGQQWGWGGEEEEEVAPP